MPIRRTALLLAEHAADYGSRDAILPAIWPRLRPQAGGARWSRDRDPVPVFRGADLRADGVGQLAGNRHDNEDTDLVNNVGQDNILACDVLTKFNGLDLMAHAVDRGPVY